MSESPTAVPTRRLVIVTGSGRSGTSTVAGTLKLLGVSIPQPEVKADSTNPRGFFEPRWAVDLHKELLKRAGVRTLDARPEALALAERIGAKKGVRTRLSTWLADVFTTPQVVVKDPRTFWFSDLWNHAAAQVGAEISYLTMLRHPTEVVGSRDAYYLTKLTEDERRARETGILAGWVNVVTANELLNRGKPRVFVHYSDLITSWRPTMRTVAERLDLTFEGDLSDGGHHPVDDFIDSDLRRVRLTWDDLDVPDHLKELADRTWVALSALADDPDDATAQAALDQARSDYRVMHAQAAALVHDATVSAISAARRETRANVRKKVEAEHARAAQQAPAGARATARRVAGRAVRTVRGLRARRG